VGAVSREVEEVDLVDLAEPHKVDRCVGAVAVKKEEAIAAVRWGSIWYKDTL
jgi:hypothetical protein